MRADTLETIRDWVVLLLAAFVVFVVASAVCGCRTTTPPPKPVDVPVVVPPEPLPVPDVPAWETPAACSGGATWQGCLEALGHDLSAAWRDGETLRAILRAHNAAVAALGPPS